MLSEWNFFSRGREDLFRHISQTGSWENRSRNIGRSVSKERTESKLYIGVSSITVAVLDDIYCIQDAIV